MKTKRILFTGVLFAATMLLSLTSCKKCTVAEEDVNTGAIVEGALVYPKVGYLTDVVGVHVTGANQYSNEFEVSFDGGVTKQAVDWNTYDILSNSMIVNCKASFVRDVTYDNVNSLVLYKVTATTCKSCEAERFIENFVLIPKVQAGYSVYADQDILIN
jgi:hypothetical protein